MAWPLPDRNRSFENDHVAVIPTELATHGAPLFQAGSLEANGEDIFLYHLGVGPFESERQFLEYIDQKSSLANEVMYTIVRRATGIVGAASLMNLRPDHGSVEVGSIWYTKAAQRTEVNTHAMYLLFCYVFDELGYRRLEWKCNNANEASRRAALRLGFQYEGLFRQHFWDKGKNRDTAWFSIIDHEWPQVRARFETELLPNKRKSL